MNRPTWPPRPPGIFCTSTADLDSFFQSVAKNDNDGLKKPWNHKEELCFLVSSMITAFQMLAQCSDCVNVLIAYRELLYFIWMCTQCCGFADVDNTCSPVPGVYEDFDLGWQTWASTSMSQNCQRPHESVSNDCKQPQNDHQVFAPLHVAAFNGLEQVAGLYEDACISSYAPGNWQPSHEAIYPTLQSSSDKEDNTDCEEIQESIKHSGLVLYSCETSNSFAILSAEDDDDEDNDGDDEQIHTDIVRDESCLKAVYQSSKCGGEQRTGDATLPGTHAACGVADAKEPSALGDGVGRGGGDDEREQTSGAAKLTVVNEDVGMPLPTDSAIILHVEATETIDKAKSKASDTIDDCESLADKSVLILDVGASDTIAPNQITPLDVEASETISTVFLNAHPDLQSEGSVPPVPLDVEASETISVIFECEGSEPLGVEASNTIDKDKGLIGNSGFMVHPPGGEGAPTPSKPGSFPPAGPSSFFASSHRDFGGACCCCCCCSIVGGRPFDLGGLFRGWPAGHRAWENILEDMFEDKHETIMCSVNGIDRESASLEDEQAVNMNTYAYGPGTNGTSKGSGPRRPNTKDDDDDDDDNMPVNHMDVACCLLPPQSSHSSSAAAAADSSSSAHLNIDVKRNVNACKAHPAFTFSTMKDIQIAGACCHFMHDFQFEVQMKRINTPLAPLPHSDPANPPESEPANPTDCDGGQVGANISTATMLGNMKSSIHFNMKVQRDMSRTQRLMSANRCSKHRRTRKSSRAPSTLLQKRGGKYVVDV